MSGYRNKKLLEVVREAPCGICGSEIEGVAAAHSNQGRHGKAMSRKAEDCFIAALCPACHYSIDQGKSMSKQERQEAWQSAFETTLLWLFESGRLVCK